MLRITPFKNAAHMKNYYKQSLHSEYYAHEAERDSYWHGKAAEQLGLSGQKMTQFAFDNLADNLLPHGRGRLTERTNEDRCPGFDFTFSVPKSVSVLHAIAKDDRILEAVQASVNETMREIEQQAMTRVRRDKQNHDRVTGNLIWTEFVHTTARPVDGVPDPHLHVHCVVLNATRDDEGQRFTAAKIRQIKEDGPYYEAAFYARVTRRLNEIGYATERNSRDWDIAGMPAMTKAAFSRRTAQIEKIAAELQIHNPEEKSKLGARTREKKRIALDRGKLEAAWAARLSPADMDAIARVRAGEGRSRDRRVDERQCLDHAIDHWFVQNSVTPAPRLLEKALRFGLGHVTPESIKTASVRHPSLLFADEDLRRYCTTRSVLAEEKYMVRFARNGRGVCHALQSNRLWRDPKGSFTNDQRAAMTHVMTSQDRVMMIRGAAGTGKSTMLETLVAALEWRGHGVAIVAPGADASRVQLRKVFEKADTVHTLLRNPKLQGDCKHGVIICDEAGMLGTRETAKLMQLADRLDARILLIGDDKQHSSVPRGDAFRILQTQAGIRPAELIEILRQHGAYKQAVTAISKGRFDVGVEMLDGLNVIREVSDAGRQADIALAYVETIRTGRTALVVAPTHAEGEQLTDLIRAALKREGRLSQDERLVMRHFDIGLSAGEKKDPAQYEPGQIIRFHRHAEGFRTGESYRVIGRNRDGHVEVQSDRRSRPQVLPLSKEGSFAVFQERVLRLAPGDQIRVTRNGKSLDGEHRLNNRSRYTLKGFTKKGDLVLDNGWTISREFGHINHAYTLTSNAAQGDACHRVILSQPSGTVGAGSAKQFYVSISRGRHDAMVFTDDRQALVESIRKLGLRRSATELMDRSKDRGRVAQIQEHQKVMQRYGTYEQTRRKRMQARPPTRHPFEVTRGR